MQKEFVPDRSARREYLNGFREKYPRYDSGIIGRSILGKDIDYYKIGCGKRHIVAVGAHRGTEYVSAAALYDFIGFISEKATRGLSYNGIDLAFLLQKFTYWIIPCLNPDGVDMKLCGIEKTPLLERQIRMNGGSIDFSEWIGNARGVDLARNYNCGFAAYRQSTEKNEIQPGRAGYSGEYPESEPETKSLANFLRALSPLALADFNLSCKEISVKPESEYARRVAGRLASSVGYKFECKNPKEVCGGLTDYAGEILGAASFDFSIGGSEKMTDFRLQGIFNDVRKLLLFLPTRL